MSHWHSFLVGLTSILALIGLAVLMVVFGELEAPFESNYVVTIHTDNAAGLRAGSQVALSGVKIGRIGEVSLQPDQSYPVRIRLGAGGRLVS